jgi:hypothetical protein
MAKSKYRFYHMAGWKHYHLGDNFYFSLEARTLRNSDLVTFNSAHKEDILREFLKAGSRMMCLQNSVTD